MLDCKVQQKEYLMKTSRLFSIILCLYLYSSLLQAQSGPPPGLNTEQKVQYEAANRFLIGLGFEDFIQQIEDTKKSGQPISDVSRYALNASSEQLGSVNAVRKLSNLTYTILVDLKKDSVEKKKAKSDLITDMIIQQLLPFPLLSAEPLDKKQVSQIKELDINKGLAFKRSIQTKRAVERFYDEKLNLVKAFMSLSEPKAEFKKATIEWLDSNLTDALADAYVFEKRQQNRLFGRALIVAFVKYLRQNNDTSAEADLKSKLRLHNLYLENYIQGYYVSNVGKDDLRGTALMSGDMAFEYSHGQEAFFTSLIMQPQTKENDKAAGINHLTNSILDSYKFLDNKKYYAILDKIDTYKELKADEQNIYDDFWNKKYAGGFSHAGLVEVKKDADTDISVAWIWDIYPEKNKVGPVRLMTPEGFSYPEKMMKIGFLRYNPEKLLASLKSQISRRGFLEIVWEGYSSFVGVYADKTEGPAVDNGTSYKWRTKVNKNLVIGWTMVDQKDAQRWYRDEVLPRVFSRVHGYMVSNEAKVFADGLVSAKDMLYCSQLVTMAYLEAINLDLQNSQDKIWDFLKYLDKSIKAVLKVNIKHRLVSPNGLVWQSDIFENLYTVYLDRDRYFQQLQKQNPTVAVVYTDFLKNDKLLNKVEINEDDLLSLNEDAIRLDFEN